jgi:hypothetical protein
VSITAPLNPGASRSASLTIAGKPYGVTQAAGSACGATDVSGLVNVA